MFPDEFEVDVDTHQQSQGYNIEKTKKIIRTQIEKLDKFAEYYIEAKIDELKLKLCIWPHEESIWHGGKFEFELTFPPEYPSRQPKAMCNTKIFHPNIDVNGNVCLNVLKLEAEGGWTAAKGISDIRDGLFHLFNEPNSGDPLNKEAADLLFNNKAEFISYVKKTLKGGTHNNVYYANVLTENPNKKKK